MGIGKEHEDSLTHPPVLCAYGPWIQEAVHFFHPEIHTAEGLYWRDDRLAWHVVMLQDASGRFDARHPGRWITVRGASADPQNHVDSEHWVQPAMLGEFSVPLGPELRAPARVEVLGSEHLESIGDHGYPSAPAPAASSEVSVNDPRINVTVVHRIPGDAGTLVIRAQIRGEVPWASPRNDGAYAYLRIAGAGAAR